MNSWYQTLVKPPFTPPDIYFSYAWSLLYILMAIAFFIVLYKKQVPNKYVAVNLFISQLFFNFLWGYLFFELKSIDLALTDIILLLIILFITIIHFFRISKIAGWLMIPYLLQVIFALYLILGIKLLN